MNDIERSGYFVSIEWDGKTPPTRWYDRLRRLGLKVRGDKEVSVLTRRYGESEVNSNRGVIFQEGMIICSSERAANVLASLADEMGASNVLVGMMDVSSYHGSQQDTETLSRISETWGKRGPKFDANAGTYSVTCLDEGQTHEVDLRDVPVLCPVCSSDHFTYRLGNRPVVTTTPDVDGWWFSRFNMGHFEIPVTRWDFGEIPQKCPDEKFSKLANNLLPDRFENDSPAKFAFWDALWIVMQSDPKTRRNRRISILGRYFSQGGTIPYLMVSRDIDLVDVAAVPCAGFLNLL